MTQGGSGLTEPACELLDSIGKGCELVIGARRIGKSEVANALRERAPGRYIIDDLFETATQTFKDKPAGIEDQKTLIDHLHDEREITVFVSPYALDWLADPQLLTNQPGIGSKNARDIAVAVSTMAERAVPHAFNYTKAEAMTVDRGLSIEKPPLHFKHSFRKRLPALDKVYSTYIPNAFAAAKPTKDLGHSFAEGARGKAKDLLFERASVHITSEVGAELCELAKTAARRMSNNGAASVAAQVAAASAGPFAFAGTLGSLMIWNGFKERKASARQRDIAPLIADLRNSTPPALEAREMAEGLPPRTLERLRELDPESFNDVAQRVLEVVHDIGGLREQLRALQMEFLELTREFVPGYSIMTPTDAIAQLSASTPLRGEPVALPEVDAIETIEGRLRVSAPGGGGKTEALCQILQRAAADGEPFLVALIDSRSFDTSEIQKLLRAVELAGAKNLCVVWDDIQLTDTATFQKTTAKFDRYGSETDKNVAFLVAYRKEEITSKPDWRDFLTGQNTVGWRDVELPRRDIAFLEKVARNALRAIDPGLPQEREEAIVLQIADETATQDGTPFYAVSALLEIANTTGLAAYDPRRHRRTYAPRGAVAIWIAARRRLEAARRFDEKYILEVFSWLERWKAPLDEELVREIFYRTRGENANERYRSARRFLEDAGWLARRRVSGEEKFVPHSLQISQEVLYWPDGKLWEPPEAGKLHIPVVITDHPLDIDVFRAFYTTPVKGERARTIVQLAKAVTEFHFELGSMTLPLAGGKHRDPPDTDGPHLTRLKTRGAKEPDSLAYVESAGWCWIKHDATSPDAFFALAGASAGLGELETAVKVLEASIPLRMSLIAGASGSPELDLGDPAILELVARDRLQHSWALVQFVPYAWEANHQLSPAEVRTLLGAIATSVELPTPFVHTFAVALLHIWPSDGSLFPATRQAIQDSIDRANISYGGSWVVHWLRDLRDSPSLGTDSWPRSLSGIFRPPIEDVDSDRLRALCQLGCVAARFDLLRSYGETDDDYGSTLRGQWGGFPDPFDVLAEWDVASRVVAYCQKAAISPPLPVELARAVSTIQRPEGPVSPVSDEFWRLHDAIEDWATSRDSGDR